MDTTTRGNLNINLNLENTQTKMNSSVSDKKFFQNKKFFLYCSSHKAGQAAELIRLFGGQVEEFLNTEISYVLTDIPSHEWPPLGSDDQLRRARQIRVSIMSLQNLISFCSKYINSQSSSEEDDETKAAIKNLRPPFLKFEDANYKYAPTVKEFAQWPEVKIQVDERGDVKLPIGKSFFNQFTGDDSNISLTPMSPQVSLATNNNTTHHNNNVNPNPNNNVLHRGVKRRHNIHCEICSMKIAEKIEDHILTQAHQANTEKQSWDAVNQVIDSLPSLSTFNKGLIANLGTNTGHQEFLCLHQMDTISQIFSR